MMIRPYLFWGLVAFLLTGIVYPVIGIAALICMVAPIVVAPFRGRFWCGNFCPRGSFYDHVLAKVSPKKEVPRFFSHPFFRGFMILFIMTVFSIQMYYAWGDIFAIGKVFVQIILITTIVGIILGVLFHHRTWCSFCPMGTLAAWISRWKKPFPLLVKDSCVSCKVCKKVCPMQIEPYSAKGREEGFLHQDCLKCARCVDKCPKKALGF